MDSSILGRKAHYRACYGDAAMKKLFERMTDYASNGVSTLIFLVLLIPCIPLSIIGFVAHKVGILKLEESK